MEKLEKELDHSDFLIVGISLDEEKNKENWLRMLDDKKLNGVQLFASGFGEIAKFYDVKSIPRYMVIDRDGKIISTDSPRPSNPKLKELLQEVLRSN